MGSNTEENQNQPGLDKLLSLSEAAERSGLSASHLRLLVRKGDVWGLKLGRNWVTTEKAVHNYLERRGRAGRQSDQ